LKNTEDALRSKFKQRKSELEKSSKPLVVMQGPFMDKREAFDREPRKLFGRHFVHYK
jgi:hypothetical protein